MLDESLARRGIAWPGILADEPQPHKALWTTQKALRAFSQMACCLATLDQEPITISRPSEMLAPPLNGLPGLRLAHCQ